MTSEPLKGVDAARIQVLNMYRVRPTPPVKSAR